MVLKRQWFAWRKAVKRVSVAGNLGKSPGSDLLGLWIADSVSGGIECDVEV